MEIRKLTPKNLSDVGVLLNEYRKFYDQPSDLKLSIQFLKNRLENDESIVFVAFIENEAVAFVQLYPTFSTVSLKPAYILNDLYVKTSARKKGIAQHLIKKCFEYCEKNNGRYVTLETSITNKNAQKLYEKMEMYIEDDVYHYIKYF